MLKEIVEQIEIICKRMGIAESTTNTIIVGILILGVSLSLSGIVFRQIKKLLVFYNRRKLNRDLHPYYTPSDVYKCTRFYVPTRYQNVSPSEDDEPGRKYIAAAKDKLIPLFFKKVFPYGKNDNKYYLILADSGMGKTTFLVNLYIRYRNSFRQMLKLNKYNIKVFPIWHHDTFDAISKIDNQENTVLLLDAFDEDIDAQKDYKKRLSGILKITGRFRIIVITCRTQFFPSKAEEPYETGYFTAGEQGEYYFQKIYLSVFDRKDVKIYLKKKFSSIWLFNKYKHALNVADKCPNLVVRPMLLSYIDELMDADSEYYFTFELYKTLISKWIDRESKKNGIREAYKSSEHFRYLLYNFSQKLAVNLYKNQERRHGYHISIDEEFSEDVMTLSNFINLAQYGLNENDTKSRSLLTRNADGDYKFSHKSIMEYFLAKEFFADRPFYETFQFRGLTMVKKFYEEMVVFKLRQLDGQFNYKINDRNNEGSFPLKKLEHSDIKKVEYLRINQFSDIPVFLLDIFINMKKLVLYDGSQMSFFYGCYRLIQFKFSSLYHLDGSNQSSQHTKNEWQEFLTNLGSLGFSEMQKTLEALEPKKIRKIFNEISELRGGRHYNDLTEPLTVLNLKRWGKNEKLISTATNANKLINDIDFLRQKLNNCDFYF